MSPRDRHCLIVAGVFPPAGGGGALRMVKLLKHLPAHGWQPHVIAPRGRSGWFADPDLLAELGGIRVTRVGLPWQRRLLEGVRQRAKDPAAKASGWLRRAARLGRGMRDRIAVPDEHLAWSGLAAARAFTLLRSGTYDLLVTASFPYSCHLAGLGLRRLVDTPWLADFADPWAGHPLRGRDRGSLGRLDEALEGRVVREADAVTVVSPGMARLMAARWPGSEGRIHLVANSFEQEEFSGPLVVRDHDRFELLFVGTLDHQVSPPRPFVEALASLLDRRPELRQRFRFRVLGGIDLEASAYVRERLGADRVAEVFRFEGYADHARAIRAMRTADALAISVAPGAHWHLTAKVFEYLASGTPVLGAVPEGDCRDLMQRCGGAALFEPMDVEGIARALETGIEAGRLGVDRERDVEAIGRLAAPEVAREAARIMDGVVAGRVGS